MRKRGIPCARRNFFSPLFPWAQTILCSRVGSQRRNKRQKKTALPSSDHPSDTQPSSAPPTFHGVFLPRPSFPLSVRNQFILDPAPLPFLPPIPLLYRRGDGDRRTGGRVDGRTTTSYDLSSLFPFFPAHTITILPSLLSLLCEVERGLGGWTDLGWSLVGRACVRGLGGGGRGGLSVTASRKGDEP